LEDTFGHEEVVVEAPQLMGKEVAVNTDIVWEAWEGDQLVGTIHTTIPKSCPTICGLSAMATHPSVRGKGLGRILFAKIIEEFESQGVTTAFLGTSNPIAAKLYHSLGFSFLSGSHVMVRYCKGDTVDFVREHYTPVREICQITKDDSAIRIPMIPLILMGSNTTVLDVNTGLYHRDFVTQRSCMGLYPRYDALLSKGGHFYAAVDEMGVLGAMLSTMPTSDGIRADFFCCDGFQGLLPRLLDACEDSVYLQIAQCDRKKQEMAQKLGFSPIEESKMLPCGDVWLPFYIWKK
jgi:GNAT superfamily N-acetyltransferase